MDNTTENNDKLINARKAKGWSQRDLVDKIHEIDEKSPANEEYVRRWERGKNPNRHHRRILLEIFGANRDEDLGFKTRIPSNTVEINTQANQPPPNTVEINTQANQLPRNNRYQLTRKIVFLLCFIAVLVFATFFASYALRYYNALDTSEPPEIIYQRIMERNPTWSDSMSKPNSDFLWDQGNGCGYKRGAYQADIAIPGGVKECIAQKTDLKNFAFQIQMSVFQGNATSPDGGGLLFRNSGSESYYRLRIGTDGSYDLIAVRENLPGRTLSPDATSILIKKGLRVNNIVTIVMLDSNIFLYINGQVLRSKVRDNVSPIGRIGVFGVQFDENPTLVIFSQAKVWTLDSRATLGWF